MQYNSTTRQVRAVYKRPCPDIAGSVDIGVHCVIARATPKLRLGAAILLGAMAAFGTGPASIARVNNSEWNTGEIRFVLQKLAELGERPRMQNCSLLAPGLDPFADAVQVFNGNAAFGAFSFGNDLLTDIVIDPSGKTALFTREYLKASLCCAGLFPLESRSKPAVTVTNGFYLRSGMPFAVRIASDIGYSKVHAKEVGGFNGRFVWQIDRAEKVELSFAINQIRLPFNAVEPLFLIFAVNKGNDYAAFRQCPQTHTVQPFEAENTFVVGDGTVGLENRALSFVPCEAFHRFADRTDSHLGGQAKTGPNPCVSQFVDGRLAEYFGLEPALGGECRCFVNALHSFEQTAALFNVGQDLQLERKLHYLGVYHSVTHKGKR